MQTIIKKALFGVVGLGVILGVSSCADKSNMIPPKPLVDFQQTQSIDYLWRTGVGNGTNEQYFSFAPTISRGVIYTVSSNGDVNAVNSTTGRRLWRESLSETLGSTPGVSGDKVFVGSITGQLYALSKIDGKTLWKAKLSSSLYAKPVYSDGIVVVHLHNGEIAALSADDGKLLWQHTSNLPELILTGNSAPLISDGKVYVGLDIGEVWALDLKSGKRLWERPIALPQGASAVTRMIDIEGTPLLSDGVLYAATFQGRLAAINIENASLLWSKKISTYTDLAISNDMLFASTEKGYLNAYSLDSGALLWSQKDLEGRQISAPVVVNNRYVAVGDFEGYLHVFGLKSGKYVARYNVGGDGVRAEPQSVANKVYLQTNNGYLYALKID
ncbi:outer membrane protein assembly factor BamB [Thiotrichales bacterium 19S11-10]|nr:outer membrane protein assembly factor BamB [Thiotrichales bacterium 19S11-10]